MGEKTTALARGKTTDKVVDGKTVAATPIVYCNGSEMGIGLIHGGNGTRWGTIAPQPRRCYSAMKILELVDDIGESTLYDCWQAASPQIGELAKKDQEGARGIVMNLGRKYLGILKSGSAGDDYLSVGENDMQRLFISRIAGSSELYKERLGNYVKQKILGLEMENMAGFEKAYYAMNKKYLGDIGMPHFDLLPVLAPFYLSRLSQRSLK